MKFDLLPHDCMFHIFSFASARDACQSSLISSTVRSVADSDTVWEKFLPSDLHEILSRLVSPLVFSSKKELFIKLCNPLLIDDGKKIFLLDKSTNKKVYILSARELSVTWATNPLYWSWKPLVESRFAEIAELRTICWLEIQAKMKTRILSPKTTYTVYLIVKFADRAYGLDSHPSEVSVKAGNYQSQSLIYLRRPTCKKQPSCFHNRSKVTEGEGLVIREREDGWTEIELGSFYNDKGDEEVTMSLKEVKGVHLKGGIIVEGIEVRPKKEQ